MSNKNNKEKSSFWKKLVGKNKSSISSLKSESNLHYDKNDTVSVKSKKRLSALLSQQQEPQPPIPKPNQQQPKVTMTNPIATIDTSPVPTPTITKDNNKLITGDATEPLSEEKPENNDNVKQTNQRDTTQPIKTDVQLTKQAVVNDDNKDEIISNLNAELEKNKATILALQKQKEAVAKDLDYLELTVDELLAEKNELIQQLEDEKIQSQHHLDDLNMLLVKMKTTADTAREQSFAKQELENFQLKANEEKENMLVELKQKDKTIRELKSKLNKSQNKTEELQESIERLVKTHAEELDRVTKINEEHEKKINELLKYTTTTHDTPSTDNTRSIPVPNNHSAEESQNDDSSVYGTPQSMYSSTKFRTPKDSVEYLSDADLDDQLMKLTKEKEKLQSFYSKIPLTGGGPKSRRRKEELESMLDQVDSQLSKVKQKIRRS